MMVKSVSNFSFLVALAAMATVSPCTASSESPAAAYRFLPKRIATCVDRITRVFDYSIGCTKAFKEQTVRSGKIINARISGNTDSLRIFLNTQPAPDRTGYATFGHLPVPGASGTVFLSGWQLLRGGVNRPVPDKRGAILRKNRILLE